MGNQAGILMNSTHVGVRVNNSSGLLQLQSLGTSVDTRPKWTVFSNPAHNQTEEIFWLSNPSREVLDVGEIGFWAEGNLFIGVSYLLILLCILFLDEVLKIVQQVLKKVSKTPLRVAKYPTGLQEKAEDLERTEQQSEKGRFMGIVGLGVVGKTTLARRSEELSKILELNFNCFSRQARSYKLGDCRVVYLRG